MGTNIKIRRFKKTDIIKLHNLSKKILNITLSNCYTKKQVDVFLKRNNRKSILQKSKERIYFVAEDKKSEKIIGSIAIKDNEITSFGVDPTFQRLGIGKLLFNKIKELAIKNGYKKLFVSSSIFGVDIYKKLGFRVLKKRQQLAYGVEYIDTWMEYKINKNIKE